MKYYVKYINYAEFQIAFFFSRDNILNEILSGYFCNYYDFNMFNRPSDYEIYCIFGDFKKNQIKIINHGVKNPIGFKNEKKLFFIYLDENFRIMDLIRIIRNIFIIILLNNSYLPLHASCIVIDNIGVAFIGNKFIGKTTAMINCLNNLNCNFVSNDKIFVKQKNNYLEVVSLPISAGIRKNTIKLFDKLNIYKKLNKKENKLALCSAIAATQSKEIIKSRGHKIENLKTFPIVISDDIESITKTKEALKILDSLNLMQDVDRLKSRKARSGKSLLRGRGAKIGKSVLFVVSNSKRLSNACGAIPGVDARAAKDLSVLDLAPGGAPIRLVVYSKSALKEIEKIKSPHLELLVNVI